MRVVRQPRDGERSFAGWYVQAAVPLLGPPRERVRTSGTWARPKTQGWVNPFEGNWGAIEVVGRYSTVNLNDQLATANGVAGGRQTVYTGGLNWYVNRNVRFMFKYLHGDIAKQVSATNFGDAGGTFDAFAMRTQVAF